LVLSAKSCIRQTALTLLVLLFAAAPAMADESHAAKAAAADLPTMLFVFMLASFIGLGVITRVSRLLHTPLMSQTNAISAIAIVGAITVTGVAHGGAGAMPRFSIINFLGAIALFASTVNIVSGFLITDRMLKMFKRQEPTKS
jgi:NAD(P) transhydrogenase subunit alpha